MKPDSRTVRVFLSSTFRDFAEERDLLVRKVFPELRRKCRERQVELVDVDLRWGITEEEAQQGKVLPICLAEIDRSRPYFMGFIGERYGWVPKENEYDASLILEQKWLDGHRGGKSVTELEMLHGVLNNPAMEDRAFFYFRDPVYSNCKGGAYLSESLEDKAKLEELKDQIRKSGFPVVENYASPESLAEHVREDLWKLIDEAFPENKVPDALALERQRHEIYSASRQGMYIGGEAYVAALDQSMAKQPRKPVMVTGASGGGKSALLANWARAYTSQHPKTIILEHYLATGADSAEATAMVSRLLREISRITGEDIVLEGDPRKALHLVSEWLGKAGAFARQQGGEFVLVLDGLDKMTGGGGLDWWPRQLPEGVGLVVSCLPGLIFDATANRMNWDQVVVSPLGREDCQSFINTYLEKFRKPLPPELVALVLQHPLSGNPLFLRTLLEEMRVFGVHEQLRQRLEHYLASGTVDDLFERVLERVEDDNRAENVRAVLEVLWAAKESFAEDELLEISGLPPAVWAPIHIALDDSLIGEGGRLLFGHDYMRKAVGDRYLASDKDRSRINKRMAEFCAQAMKGGKKDTSPYVRRHAVEHFLEAENWDNVTVALSDLEFIEARAIAQELPAMLLDYAQAIKLLPEGENERQVEVARQAELDRYAKDMVEYAAAWSRIRDRGSEAEPLMPRPVECVRLWTSEEMAAERKRMTYTPNRLDIVKAFRVFVATNFGTLQKRSTQEGFVSQQAYNSQPYGPLHNEATRLLETKRIVKILRRHNPEDIHDPLNPRLGVLDENLDEVSGLALSADGRRIVSCGLSGSLRVWDLESGECLKTVQVAECAQNAVSLTFDGSQAVSAGADGVVRVWNSVTGECLRELRGHTHPINAISLTPDGRMAVTGGRDKTLRVWDLASGECSIVLAGHSKSVEAVAVTADGRHVVSGSEDNTLRIWSVATGDCLRVLQGHKGAVKTLAISYYGNVVVSGSGDKTLRVWNLDSGACLRTIDLDGRTFFIEALSVTPDGRLALVGSGDKRLRVFDIATGNCLRTLYGHSEMITAVCNTNDVHRVISGSLDKTILLWDLQKGENQKSPDTTTHRVSAIEISPDGQRVFSVKGGVFQEWKPETQKCNHRLQGNDLKLMHDLTKWITSYAGKAVSLGPDKTMRFWVMASGECEKEVERQSLLVATNGGSQAVSVGADGVVRVWNLATAECVREFDGYTSSIVALNVTLDGRFVVAASGDQTIQVWNLATGECADALHVNTSGLVSISLTPNRQRALLRYEDGKVFFTELASGKISQVLPNHETAIESVSLTPDGRLAVAQGLDQALHIWDVEAEKCLRVVANTNAITSDIIISPDGSLALAAVGYRDICAWNLASGEAFCLISQGSLSCFGIHWGLRMLVTGSFDGRVLFYDILGLGPLVFVTTAHRSYCSSDFRAGPPAAYASCCGTTITIPISLADRIEHWENKGGDDGYTDAALLFDCPNCKNSLRMNPFFSDTKHPSN